MPERSTPPIATWNPARGAWLDPTSYLCGHSAPYSATWPTSGITLHGVSYALPTSALPTPEPGCSSSRGLLNTPLTTTATGVQTLERQVGGRGSSTPMLGTPRTSSGNGVGQYEDSERGTRGRLEAQVDQLLKTPNANLATNGGSQHPDKRKEGRHGPTLADEVEHLLPTPLTSNSKSARTMSSGGQRQGGGHSGPPGLDETAQLLAGQRPAHLPPTDQLPARTRELVEHLLPTPVARDWKDGAAFTPHPEKGKLTHSVAAHLLPTPQVADSSGGHMSRSGDRSNELLLPGVARQLAGEQMTSARPVTTPPTGTTPTGSAPGCAAGHAPIPSSGDLMLPTPTATPYGSNQSPSPGAAVRPSLTSLASGQLLPTPTATDSKGSRGSSRDGTPYTATSGVTLTDATERLLPTPKATDGTKGGPGQRGSSGDLMLPSAVQLMIPVDGDRTGPSSAAGND